MTDPSDPSDPFDRLHRPMGRTDPDARFAADLLARIEAAFAAGPGVDTTAAAARQPCEGSLAAPATHVTIHLEESDAMDLLQLDHRRRRRTQIASLAAIVTAAALIGSIAVARSDSDTVDTVDAPTSTEVGPTATTAGDRVAPDSTTAGPFVGTDLPPLQELAAAGGETFRVPGFPDQVVVTDGAVWIERPNQPIERFDPSTFASLGGANRPTSEALVRPAVAFGSLWVPDLQAASIIRVDITTAAVQAEVAIPGGFAIGGNGFMSDLAVTPDGIWAVSRSPHKLVRVDPATNAVAETRAAPANALSIAYGAGSLWSTRLGSSGGKDGGPTLDRIDPVSGQTTATIPLGFRPGRVVVSNGGVWVLSGPPAERAMLAHIDPTTDTVVAQIDLGGLMEGEIGIAVTDDSVWLSGLDNALLSRIDPATNRVVARYGPPSLGGGMVAAGDGAVWVTDTSANAVHRLPV